jgi:hypothetical protein
MLPFVGYFFLEPLHLDTVSYGDVDGLLALIIVSL